MRIIRSMRGQKDHGVGDCPAVLLLLEKINGTMKKTGKTVAYSMVPSLRFLSTSVPQGSLQGPSLSELVSDGFREDLAEGLG